MWSNICNSFHDRAKVDKIYDLQNIRPSILEGLSGSIVVLNTVVSHSKKILGADVPYQLTHGVKICIFFIWIFMYFPYMFYRARYCNMFYIKSVSYRQTFIIRCSLVGNKLVDHSDVAGVSPVGAAPTTSSFLTQHLASLDWAKTAARWDKKHIILGIWCILC